MAQEKYNGWTNYETWKSYLEFFDGHRVDDRIDGDYCYDMLTEYLGTHDYTDMEDNFKDRLANRLLTEFVDNVNFDEIADMVNEMSGIENECQMCGKPIDYNQLVCSSICHEASMR
jgi:hypothetical protein